MSVDQIQPTPVGAGGEAMVAQPAQCVVASVDDPLPTISSDRHADGTEFPCIEFDGIMDSMGEDDPDSFLRFLVDQRSFIDQWAEVTDPDITVAPSVVPLPSGGRACSSLKPQDGKP